MNLIYNISPLILQKAIWIPTRIILKLFIHLRVEGLENLAYIKSNIIFASNHNSELDPILLPASLPFFSRFSPIFYAALNKGKYRNSGWRQIFYGGMFFKFWGAHPLYIGLKDYKKSLINHIEILKAGKNLLFFPEGKITLDGNIGPARGGTIYLARTTKTSIIPVGIKGPWRISIKEFLLRKKKVTIRFGKVMHYDNFTDFDYRVDAEKVI